MKRSPASSRNANRCVADLLLARDDVDLPEDEIRALCDPANYLGLAEAMVDRVLALPRR